MTFDVRTPENAVTPVKHSTHPETTAAVQGKIDRGVSLARAVLMVTPTHFFANAETAQDNSFMPVANHSEEDTQGPTQAARAEFDSVVAALRNTGIEVRTYMQQAPALVDSLFPNNWLSTHKTDRDPGRLVVTYPMRYPSRQAEKNMAIVNDLKQHGAYDYVEFDNMNCGAEWVLEGTGALVFDRRFRRIYAGISQRCTRQAVTRFHEVFNEHYTDRDWDLVVFPIANPLTGVPIYHTNVVMAVLPHHIVLCSAAIPDEASRAHVVSLALADYGTDGLIDISFDEVKEMCGNVLALASNRESDKACVVISARARKGLNERHFQRLAASYQVITVDVSTIEHFSGGSIRCMMAEIFE